MTETSRPDLPVQAFQAMEKRDEEQILVEMRGELVEEFVYSIPIQGKQVTNLSYAGVKEAIRKRGNVELLQVRTEETETEIRGLVQVRDLDNRIDVLGASSADKGKPFAYVLALNKAERNAFSKLIPAKWYATLIQDWLQKHRTPIPSEAHAATTQEQKDKKPLELTQEQAEKLEVFHADGDFVYLRQTSWLSPKIFGEIAEVIKGLGGSWLSQGRDSCFRMPNSAYLELKIKPRENMS